MKRHPLTTVVLFVALVLLVGLACGLPSQPNECSDFTIPPNGAWTASWFDTGIELRAGQTVIFSAKGEVRPSTSEDVSAGPDGTAEIQNWLDSYSFNSGWGHEAVIARIGGGEILYIGAGQQLELSRGGTLELGVNDTDPGNNEGGFDVEICR